MSTIFGALQKIREDNESKMKVRVIMENIDWKMDEMLLGPTIIEVNETATKR